MMRGGAETTPAAAPVTHAAKPSASSTPTETSRPTTAPTVAVNGRNPFASTATGTSSGSGASASGGSTSTKVTTRTVTSSSVVVRSRTSTATRTVTGPTATVTATPVYLTLLSVDATRAADFIVNGTASPGVADGSQFGAGLKFTYVAMVVPVSGTYSGQKCASVAYVDSAAILICPSQQIRLS